MPHRCPVCRARLWKRPFARRLQCPRCGAEFRPTVPLALFQLLTIVLLLALLGVALTFSQPYFWLVVLTLLVIAFMGWFLPKMIRLEVETPGLTVAEGPGPEALRPDWPPEDSPETLRSGHLLLIAAVLLSGILILTVLRLLL